MSPTCKNCKNWKSPHQGMTEPEAWGSCDEIEKNDASGVFPICEGCVDVTDRVDDLEILTGKDFGCRRFAAKEGRSYNKELLNAARMICSAGADITIRCYDGFRSMGPEDFVDYINDPDNYLAKASGVTLKKWKAWESYGGAFCNAKDPSGVRCGTLVRSDNRYKELTQFTPGMHDRCPRCAALDYKTATNFVSTINQINKLTEKIEHEQDDTPTR